MLLINRAGKEILLAINYFSISTEVMINLYGLGEVQMPWFQPESSRHQSTCNLASVKWLRRS
jgi:hypothetical protein